ncbi:MAG: ABC transporter permease [Endozoicomonas sp.]
MNNSLKLSWRFLLRDWRSGELWLLVLSLLMAVSVSTAISLFSERLQLALGRQVAEVLGADMVIRSPRPLSDKVQEFISDHRLTEATVLEFPSVVIAGEEMQLVSAKAVTDNYPLRGHLRISDQPFTEDRAVQETPLPGEAWLEPRLFPLLGVKIGDSLQLGETELRVARVITLETDRGGDFYSFSPRLMFNLDDLDKTGIIQPGSRVTWKIMLAGERRELERFKEVVEPELEPSERLIMADDSRRDLRNSVVRLRQFLGLGSLAAILLAGVAVAMSSRRFAERRFDAIAVMRCLGARQSQVMTLLVGELLLVALLVAIPGVAIGWLLQAGVVRMLAGILPAWLPQAGYMPMLIGGGTGVITLAGFGLAPLLRLQEVTPLRVLRRDLTPAPARTWMVYGLSLAAMVLMLWYHTGQLLMTIGITLGIGAVLLLITLGVKASLGRIQQRISERPVPLYWRLGLKRLLQEQGQTSAQLMAFSLTFMAMAIVLLLRTDLLERWQQQLPEDTPNYFALNIQPAEVADFRGFLDQNAIESTELYPMVRGRLTHINDVETSQAVSQEQRQHNSLNRELNLTWAKELPESNQILEGDWWEGDGQGQVSVESEMAEDLGIGMGDKLTFMISGQPVSATITSVRKVQWESFQPNFYLMFPEQTLDGLPATWLNSFFLPVENKILLNDLVTRFPTMTLLDLDAVIGQVQAMLKQSTLAVEAMLLALLLAGLLVLASAIESSLDERLREGALIRSLGGTRRQLLTMQVGEFVLIGALSGVIAVAGTEFCSWWLNVYVFELSWEPAVWLWIMLPASSALLIGLAGFLGVRRVIRQSPSIVLSEN